MQNPVVFEFKRRAEAATGYAAHLATRKRAYPGSKALRAQEAALKRAQIDAGLWQGRYAEALADEAGAYHG